MPNKGASNCMALYFPFRSKVLRNLDKELDFSISNKGDQNKVTAKGSEKIATNMWSMRTHLKANCLLPDNPSTEVQLL